MRAALYLRRSTEEHQAESLATQEDGARRFLKAKGWSLAPEHIYTDSGISRAEFLKRPGLRALIAGAKDHAFDVVITRDDTRLGGDLLRVAFLINDLIESGCKLFYYSTGEEVRCDDPTSKMVVAMKGFAAEMERDKVSSRTYEAVARKARAGLNAGGRCYGYDNVEVAAAPARRVEYKINDAQATIVREIFTRYAAGEGLGTISKDLNARGVAPPRSSSWHESAIHEILRRPRYRGVIEWGRTRKTYRGGTKVRVKRASEEIVRHEMPGLRIVDDRLWASVQAQIAQVTRAAPKGGRPPKYLLSTILRCGECAGPLKVIDSRAGTKTIKVYACANYHSGRRLAFGRGPKLRCANTLRRPISALDDAVVGWLAKHLRDDVIDAAVKVVRRRVRERLAGASTEGATVDRDIVKLRREEERLVRALTQSDDPPAALVAALKENEARVRQLESRRAMLATTPGTVEDEVRRLSDAARRRLTKLQATIARSPGDARKLLQLLFPRGIMAFPMDLPRDDNAASRRPQRRYRLDGTACLGPILDWEAEPSPGITNMASPGGFEPPLAT